MTAQFSSIVRDDGRQQDELVAQLQDQHYEQYMEHVQSQLLLHQRQQHAQLHSIHHKHLPAVANDNNTLPSNQLLPSNPLVEFHTEAGVATETCAMETCRPDDEVAMATCHHDNEVAATTEGEVNGASDVALLSTSSVGNEHDEDADESDIDDSLAGWSGPYLALMLALQAYKN